MEKVYIVILITIGLMMVLLFALFFIRAFSEKQIDDVSPEIECEEKLLEKSDVFFVVPKFNGAGISDEKNREWLEKIRDFQKKGKKLALHGVYHTYNEFETERSEEYLRGGIAEFEKAFGFKPNLFKAPQLALNNHNREIIEANGMNVKGLLNQITHKVYHCNDTGIFPNWLIDIF